MSEKKDDISAEAVDTKKPIVDASIVIPEEKAEGSQTNEDKKEKIEPAKENPTPTKKRRCKKTGRCGSGYSKLSLVAIVVAALALVIAMSSGSSASNDSSSEKKLSFLYDQIQQLKGGNEDSESVDFQLLKLRIKKARYTLSEKYQPVVNSLLEVLKVNDNQGIVGGTQLEKMVSQDKSATKETAAPEAQ